MGEIKICPFVKVASSTFIPMVTLKNIYIFYSIASKKST